MKKLIFIHHSCGKFLLEDNNGGLAKAMAEKGYFVSDTYYKWGPDQIGDYTDIGHWWLWFRGADSDKYLNAVYSENGRLSDYSRQDTIPEGENSIVLFKSCYPNSILKGNPDDAIPTILENPLCGQSWKSEYHTVANAKGIYIDLLEYFHSRQDKLFIAITAPPVSDATWSDNARTFNNWLSNDWLKDYPYKNVAVFDFYNILTCNENGKPANILQYPTGEGDDHPNVTGNRKAAREFIPFLNKCCDEWEKYR